MMQMIHEVPGTTFSNPVERGEYDSDGRSCLTLAELERWFALAIVGRYHGEVHGKLLEPPIAKWLCGVNSSKLREVTQADAFFIDFLPIIHRRITREGFRVDHISYFCNALHPWIAERDSMDRFTIRRDPRDLSRIFVLDPKGTFYLEVPCAQQGRPRITLFEHREAIATLREQGRLQVDEAAIFRAVAAQRDLVKAAAARTRSARRRLARTGDISQNPAPVDQTDGLGVEDFRPITALYPITNW